MAEATVGLSLPTGVDAKSTDRVKVMEFDFKLAVRHVHVGSFDQLENVYDMIARGLEVKGQKAGFPVVLKILDDPTQTPPEKVRTVINVPVSCGVARFGFGKGRLSYRRDCDEGIRTDRTIDHRLRR